METATRHGRRPTRQMLATRSATALSRLSGQEKRQALSEHFEQFPPAILQRRHQSCEIRR